MGEARRTTGRTKALKLGAGEDLKTSAAAASRPL
jgi:hypothetical protein